MQKNWGDKSHPVIVAIAFHPTQQSWKRLYIRNRQYTDFTSQIFGVVGLLGKNLDLYSPLGYDVRTNSDHKIQKIKLYSIRALKRHLNEKMKKSDAWSRNSNDFKIKCMDF